MNILLLTHMYPYPPNDGGKIVTFNTIKYDVEYGNKLNIISFHNKKICSDLDKYAKVHIIEKDTENNYMKMLTNLFSDMPYNLSKYYDMRVILKIEEILKNEEIDIAIIDHLHMAIYGEYLKKHHKQIPVILRQHNVESTIMERFYQNQRNILIKNYAKLQYKKLYSFEKKVVELFDKCFMITDDDTDRIKNMNPNVNAITIPAGVDIERYQPLELEKIKKSIVFLGAMNWMPNEDGVLWFVENIFNKVVNRMSDAVFYIVGKNPSEKIKQLHNGINIIVTGFVEDDREYIAKSEVFIVPLRIGGGMRIKILNAMSMAKSVISTSIGAEGIEIDGEDIVIADAEDKFADKIVELLNDEKLREKIGKKARSTIIKKYSWESICKKVNHEYRKLVGEKNE